MTYDQLDALGIDHKWLSPLEETFVKYDISSPLRQAAFIGQCQHESANFKVLEENLKNFILQKRGELEVEGLLTQAMGNPILMGDEKDFVDMVERIFKVGYSHGEIMGKIKILTEIIDTFQID